MEMRNTLARAEAHPSIRSIQSSQRKQLLWSELQLGAPPLHTGEKRHQSLPNLESPNHISAEQRHDSTLFGHKDDFFYRLSKRQGTALA
jgi:hypothetical protein